MSNQESTFVSKSAAVSTTTSTNKPYSVDMRDQKIRYFYYILNVSLD
jgi:hypothetical protein